MSASLPPGDVEVAFSNWKCTVNAAAVFREQSLFTWDISSYKKTKIADFYYISP